MRVLVCGGRDYADRDKIYSTLDDFCLNRGLVTPRDQRDSYGNYMPTGITIIHGGAHGADQIATDWAVVNWVDAEEYRAEWETYGKAAGAIRNRRMIDEGEPDIVIAFPGGRGTANMVALAKAQGIPVMKIT